MCVVHPAHQTMSNTTHSHRTRLVETDAYVSPSLTTARGNSPPQQPLATLPTRALPTPAPFQPYLQEILVEEGQQHVEALEEHVAHRALAAPDFKFGQPPQHCHHTLVFESGRWFKTRRF